MFRRTLAVLMRGVLALVTLAVIAAGLFYLRLLQGPVELPAVAGIAANQINALDPDHEVTIGNIVVDLSSGLQEPLVQFRDVSIASANGIRLFTLPKVAVNVRLVGLLEGSIHPNRVTVRDPQVRVTRDANGNLRLAIGDGVGMSLTPSSAEASDAGDARTEDTEAERVIAQLVGDVEAPAFMESLKLVRIANADLSYQDAVLESAWRSRGATLEVVRFDGGARAVVAANVIDATAPGAAVRIVAERRAGQEQTELRASFGQIRTSVLAAQLPALNWISVLEGVVEGRATATLDGDGTVTDLTGTIVSEDGRFLGLGDLGGFDVAEIGFAVDPARDMITLERAVLASRSVDTSVQGIAQLRRDADGEVAGIAGQLEVQRIFADLPKVFSDPVAFDGGQLNFRWSIPDSRFEIVDTTLARGDLRFELDGRAIETEAGWITDLRAEAVNMDIAGLLTHWPLVAAPNARAWLDKNILQADVTAFLAQMRFGDGDPRLSLDFQFKDLISSYIDGMSPIEQAAGRGHLSYHDVNLFIDSAVILSEGNAPIRLDGSSIAIRDFWGEVTPAHIEISGSGETAAVLDLINEQPLGLVDRLDVALARPAGRVAVSVQLDFPLINALKIEEIGIQTRARLSDLETELKLPGRDAVSILGPDVLLEATVAGLRMRGPMVVADIPVVVDWRENYGAAPGSRILEVSGNLTPEITARFGLDALPFVGPTPLRIELSQTTGQPFRFDVTSDLTQVDLDLAELGWFKPPGTAGSMRARGVLADGVQVEALEMQAAGLALDATLKVDGEGDVRDARFRRLAIPGLADISGSISVAPDEVFEVVVDGGTVDLSGQLENAGGEGAEAKKPGRAFRLRFDLDRMVLADGVALVPASGRLDRTTEGTIETRVDGMLGGQVPVGLVLSKPAAGRGLLRLVSPDAGLALEAAGLYEGARGGELRLDAEIGAEGEPELSGTVRIDDIVVRSDSTFRSVLRQGGLDSAEREMVSGGLGFRKVRVPFSYDGDVLTLEDAIASSPALALKLNGTLNTKSQVLDMMGVASPAYALTGVLNEVPLLGELLSGGEGEGILAMTFRLDGQMDNPGLSVNPLSLLAPGFLRNIFQTGKRNDPANNAGPTGPEDR